MELRERLCEQEQGRKIQSQAEKVWGWDTPAGLLRAERRLKEFLKHLTLKKNSIVLEIGCGTGFFTHLFSKNNILPIGVDISYDLLRKARSKNPGVVFVQADVERLPFKENVFDCVMGVSILHHLNIQKALEALKLVLTDNGIMILSEPNLCNPQIFFQKKIGLLKKMMRDTPSETAFLKWELKKTLRQNGFSDILVCPFEFLHPLTPRRLIPSMLKLQQFLERTPLVKEIAGSLLIVARKHSVRMNNP